METEVIILALELFKSADWESFLIGNRISVRCKYNTDSCIVLKLQINRVKFSIDTCFHDINDIIFHTWKNDLCLRISKTGIVLKNLWSFPCQHQSEENNSGKWSSLRSHSIYSWLINILLTEFIYFFCIERTWREISHTAGIQSLISILGTFVILCGRHDADGLSVHIGQNRYFTSGHKFFDYHRISGISEFLIFHDRTHAFFCLFECITDQHTLSECQTVCL